VIYLLTIELFSVVRRAPSLDNMFLLPDGSDSPSLIYRTKPYEQQSPYPPRVESERLHFDVLNATQYRFYKTGSYGELLARFLFFV
jgi:hypothetical protein